MFVCAFFSLAVARLGGQCTRGCVSHKTLSKHVFSPLCPPRNLLFVDGRRRHQSNDDGPGLSGCTTLPSSPPPMPTPRVHFFSMAVPSRPGNGGGDQLVGTHQINMQAQLMRVRRAHKKHPLNYCLHRAARNIKKRTHFFLNPTRLFWWQNQRLCLTQKNSKIESSRTHLH